ncbi:MAG: (Fe-S)-binding protein [Crenarchaeota archaeon]|nr:(Fe-S)-binding protein [Thermoproteota archaeon]
MLEVREILLMMAEETRKRGLPLPVPRDALTSWAEGLGLARSGDVLLYTGALYQLTPYINAFVDYLERLEGSKASGFLLKAARRLKLTGLASAIAKPRKEEVEYSQRVLRAIVSLLKRAGVEVAYNPDVDGYSGVLLYDLGLDDVFKEHAVKVYRALKDAGPSTVITVDPHTTHVLRNVYPKYIDGFDLTVKSYLEVLAEKGLKLEEIGGEWVIHDPCLYARSLGIIDQPRTLLRNAGIRVLEPKRSGKMTYCCGGPLESIAPRLSKKIASRRIQELSAVSKNILTLCPICYANLSRVSNDETVRDIALVLTGDLR